MSVLEALAARALPSDPMTLAEWDALPEDRNVRLECMEGVVHMAPFADKAHQNASWGLKAALRGVVASDLEVVQDLEVLVTETPLTLRRPDVIVRERTANTGLLDVALVRLAVEILSPTSRRTDRVTKLSEYQDAGIPEYWIVDLGSEGHPAVLTALRLDDEGAYELVGEFTGHASVPACGADVVVDLDKITD